MQFMTFIIAPVSDLAATTSALPVHSTSDYAPSAVNDISHITQSTVVDGMKIARSLFRAKGLAHSTSNTTVATTPTGSSMIIEPRRYIVFVQDGHLTPVWIAVTVICSILFVAGLVSLIIFCCTQRKLSPKARENRESLAERAAIAKTLIAGTDAFNSKNDDGNNKTSSEDCVEGLGASVAGAENSREVANVKGGGRPIFDVPIVH